MGVCTRQLNMTPAGVSATLFAQATKTGQVLDVGTIQTKHQQASAFAPRSAPGTLVHHDKRSVLVPLYGLNFWSVPDKAGMGVLEGEWDAAFDKCT